MWCRTWVLPLKVQKCRMAKCRLLIKLIQNAEASQTRTSAPSSNLCALTLRWVVWHYVSGEYNDTVYQVSVMTLCIRWVLWHCVSGECYDTVYQVSGMTLRIRWVLWHYVSNYLHNNSYWGFVGKSSHKVYKFYDLMKLLFLQIFMFYFFLC